MEALKPEVVEFSGGPVADKSKTHYRKDLSGQKFGCWVVLSFSRKAESKNMWNCICSCGTQKEVYQNHLKTGGSQSCGCMRKKQLQERLFVHGETGSRLQSVHTHIKQRCRNRKNKGFKNYGMRGIDICPEWESFLNFREWALANGYQNHLTIDRADNDKGYSPKNCRWVDHSVQNANKRRANGTKSGFIGVTKRKYGWRGRVSFRGEIKNTGTFKTAIQSALTRDKFVIDNGLPHTLNFKRKGISYEKR